jgi:AraC family ethanolamine operon transcriptional activator
MNDFHYASQLTRDVHEHAAGLSAWEQHHEQLSAGRFEGLLQDLRVGPVQIFQERASQAVFQNGRPRPGTVTLALTQAGAQPGWFCGHRLADEQAFIMPAHAEFELVAAAHMNLVAVCIDTAYLDEIAARLRGTDFRLQPAGPAMMDRAAFDRAAFRELTDCAMALARDRPGLLAMPAARRMLALSLADAVLECLAPGRFHAELPASAAARRRIVASAREHMLGHADEAIRVPELCAATGVSRRALQYAFEDVLHLSPVTYLRALRLNRVRAELLAGCADSVGDIAARWGFWHLSRFAAEYRELFGELPSATRTRAAAGRPGPAHPA